MITLIAAIGRNNEIGFKNTLLCKIPEDMKHFKDYTMGKVIIMGSNTFTSIGSKALPGRKNIVITNQELKCVSAIRAESVDSALSISHCYDELIIIGGASIYRQTIDKADKLVITHIDKEFEADTFFPKIDMSIWKINGSKQSQNELFNYRFVEYVKNEHIRVIE